MTIPAGTFRTDPDPANTTVIEGITNNEICDRTGFRVPRGELKREWNGALVRSQSWEPRHPQDFVRTRTDTAKGSPRPEPEDTFIADEDQFTPEDL